MPTLLDKLQNRQAEDSAEEGLDSSFNPEQDLAQVPDERILSEHLDKLPTEAKEFLAAFMTQEFAQAVGLLTGSEELFNFVNSRADSSRVLMPLPREVAQQIVGEVQQQATVPAEQAAMPMEAPMGPQGAMGV